MRKGETTTICDWGIETLLETYPSLRVQPQNNGSLVLAGNFDLHARFKKIEIRDTFSIEIEVPDHFPIELPRVREVGGRIPQEFHHYPDGKLCLGSPIRLRMHTRATPDLATFVDTFVVPYLYGFSHKERYGTLPFGELEHGYEGMIEDLKSFLKVGDERTCIELLRLTGLQRRKANRLRCPCGSGFRVGQCHNSILNPLRARLERLWCRDLYHVLRDQKLREKQQSLVRTRNRGA
ncbi:MAG: hypothetical protein IH987_01655 [Planctomycetes bacterium]|nr:hypothetical protein [Planctomycetota bacterium]